ncbi:MAG: Stk1 family PASTA domain-containing Ser/Thr kinase [Oscillospiraceae bacterium]|nr:Stk1 family PASTA domain-containing Ser/Thr kinase [Oscillospiraceae bacterium]
MDSYVGKRLDGRYEIREIIGVGGMAVVYKAYDNIDDRIVAIKILKEEFLANEEFRRRFKNESKAIAVLSHPNIVKVYDVSFGDRLQYIVMEYIEGITLKEYIEQQKVINWKEAVHFATQILRALQHAHDKGIVHRDVKPQNIILLQNGNIKVTDFGIARFSRGETRTMTESAIGSVHYISPEQARGEITDDKADIYSVGVVLYEMITGKLPFESDSAVSVAIMQLQNEAIHPRDINPEIPIGLEQITLRAMQKSTKDRYQSAAEMLLDLDEFRRNPAIKFDYSYFVDKEPTKFLSQQAINPGAVSKPVTRITNEVDDYDYEEDDEETNKTLPILVGVMSALLAVIIIVVLFLALFTDLFKSNKIEVPELLGLNYAEEVQGNSKYSDWSFEVDYVTSTTYQPGQISKQSPYGGAKAKKGSTIKLEVVSSGSLVEIPDIKGYELGTAKTALQSAGFSNISVQTIYDKNADPNTVVKTDPSIGNRADTSSTIVVYVATDKNENEVDVPDVKGMNYYENPEDVEAFFTTSELELGKVTEEDSDKKRGYILDQSIDGGEKAAKGTKINITVSSGKAKSSTATVSLTLPNTSSTQTLKIFVANELYDSKTVLCNGANYECQINGEGSGKSIQITIGQYTVYTATADFTTSPATLTDAKTYAVPSEKEIPDVRGKTVDEAKSILSQAGFTNVTTREEITADDDLIGKVTGASPSIGTKAKTTDTITLKVGKSIF